MFGDNFHILLLSLTQVYISAFDEKFREMTYVEHIKKNAARLLNEES